MMRSRQPMHYQIDPPLPPEDTECISAALWSYRIHLPKTHNEFPTAQEPLCYPLRPPGLQTAADAGGLSWTRWRLLQPSTELRRNSACTPGQA